MLTTEQKSVIEYFAANTYNYGSYELARRITRRQFNLVVNNDKVRDITASYYSVLNVIRRCRQKKAVAA